MKKLLTGLLITACVTGLAAPARPAIAAGVADQQPMQLAGVVSIANGKSMPVVDGGVIARSTRELQFTFSQALGERISGTVTVTDSTGADAGWLPLSGGGDYLSVMIPTPPAANATYTVTIKGGEAGLLSDTGAQLAGDVTFMIRTDDGDVRRSITIPTAWGVHQAAQSEIYRLEAGAGMLNLRLGESIGGQPVRVVLEDTASGEFLLDKALYGEELKASVTLPRAGTYRLLLTPNMVPSVTIDALNLVASTAVPALRLPAMKPYETHNESFTFEPVVVGMAASVKVAIKDQVLSNGPAAPVTVDPAALGDGVYALNVVAEGEGGNQGLSARTFLVDREAAFGDVGAGHWARPYVEVMHHLGVVNGRSAGSFAPGESVTRAEFAKLMALTLGLEPSGQAEGPAFADVATDDWARPYILALAERSLIRGEVVGDQTYFWPERTITRAEAATIVGRALGVDDAGGGTGAIGFGDAEAIPAWARPAVAALSEAKWINGFPDGNYYPGNQLQRDQAARVLANFLGM